MFGEYWDRLTSTDRGRDLEEARQARRVAAFDLAMLMWALVFTPVYVVLGVPQCATVLVIASLILLLVLLALERGYSPQFCGNVFCLDGLYAFTTLALLNGGRGAPSVMWYAAMPVIAVYLCGVRWGIFWTFVTVLAITGFALADLVGFTVPNFAESRRVPPVGVFRTRRASLLHVHARVHADAD